MTIVYKFIDNGEGPTSFPPNWAVAWGEDNFGLWATCVVSDDVCLMRWIRPGLLVSEQKNELVCEEGFWLLDARIGAQTWAKRKREKARVGVGVSRADCLNWLKKYNLNNRYDKLLLPTAEQWKYACWNQREGYPAGFVKKINRKEAICNQFGLHDVFSSGWEWCVSPYGSRDSLDIDRIGRIKNSNKWGEGTEPKDRAFFRFCMIESDRSSGTAKYFYQNLAQINAGEKQDDLEWSHIHKAAVAGDLAYFTTLIKTNADIDCTDFVGRTPLHLACWSGHNSLLSMLLSHGADLTAVTKNGWSSLHYATEKGHLDVVMSLLNAGAQVDLSDTDGWTPLHLAVVNNKLEVLSVLIQFGADVNSAIKNGLSPLHLAVQANIPSAILILLDAGANSDVSALGVTPAELASRMDYTAIKRLFFTSEKGAYDEKDLCRASSLGDTFNVKKMIDFGIDLECKHMDSFTPLHLAVHNKRLGVLIALLEAGAEVDAKDFNKSTPLHHAVYDGWKEGVRVLCEFNADSDVVDADFDTPVSLAERKGYVDILKSLTG
ncbi:ankyrin repeat domain-containing protein [Halodesulfovibrio marinisediminis]|uniref:Ankyrin repeat n=1 Tax=Halodesulfovibrio marinisediminis DSM 17456 TaxID=1121457 RepID=A0A1N6JAY8_9BACT|nr:ankyrin repeat domain-containing protein [Halodesulfovibrio marinisediminis]SIO41296.1 Ankyrin repeat [Halodesulfovibrio marinisediminis DSM 17456]